MAYCSYIVCVGKHLQILVKKYFIKHKYGNNVNKKYHEIQLIFKCLKLDTIELRRLYIDFTLRFKICNGYVALGKNDFF